MRTHPSARWVGEASHVCRDKAPGAALSRAAATSTWNGAVKNSRTPWTVMVYYLGGAHGHAAAVADLGAMKRVGSTGAVSVVAQLGQGLRGAAQRYYLRKGTTLAEDVVAELAAGEAEGDPLALQSFIVWAARRWPADRLLLVLCDRAHAGTDAGSRLRRDHRLAEPPKGDQRSGVADRRRSPASIGGQEARASLLGSASRAAERAPGAVAARIGSFDAGAGDPVGCDELKRVLQRVRRVLRQSVDVVGMDACPSGTIEGAHQLRDGARYLVGSEQRSCDNGWPYQTVLSALAARPQMSAASLCTLIVRNYLAAYASHDGVTQSAIALGRSAEAAAAVAALARVLQTGAGHPATRLAIMQARAQVQCFANSDTVDLGDLCGRLQATVGKATSIGRASQRVITALVGESALVIATGCKGASLRHSRGITIHFPTTAVAPSYAKLDFARASGWATFLRAYIAATRRRTGET